MPPNIIYNQKGVLAHNYKGGLSTNKEHRRQQILKCQRKKRFAKYGITEQIFNEMLLNQDNKCAVCNNSFEGKRINIDHDHKTGVVRGLLCYSCNVFRVGKNREDTIQQVYDYLKKSSKP